jgi:hypothetical protein
MPGSPACASVLDHARHAQCEISELNRRTAESARRTAETERRTAESVRRTDEALAVIDCVKYLTAGVRSGTFAKAEILQKAGGKLNDANACSIARAYGFGRKAENNSPAVN